MDATLRELRVVALVEELGSFTAAADRLRVAQPSLSQTVRDLERRMRVPLFERTTRRVEATEEGVQLAQAARAVLNTYAREMRVFRGFLDGTRGVVRMATLPSLAATLLPRAIARYRERRPEIELQVRDEIHGDVMRLLEGGHIDLALSLHEDSHGRRCRRLAGDRLHAVGPAGHPVLRGTAVPWRRLAGHPFVAFDPTSSVRVLVEQTFERTGIVTGPVSEAHSIVTVAGLVKAGFGITVAPAFVLPLMQFAGVGSRPLCEPTVTRELCTLTAHRDRVPPATADFRDAIHELFSGTD